MIFISSARFNIKYFGWNQEKRNKNMLSFKARYFKSEARKRLLILLKVYFE